MDDPGSYSRSDGGEDNIDVEVVGLEPVSVPLRPQIEDAVSAQGGGGAVIEVKEPDCAVDQGEADGQKGVHRAHRQAVEGELERLLTGLVDLPSDIAGDHNRQRHGQELGKARQGKPALAGAAFKQRKPPLDGSRPTTGGPDGFP